MLFIDAIYWGEVEADLSESRTEQAASHELDRITVEECRGLHGVGIFPASI